jgi:parallel beta-helix repeat protein
MIKSKRKSVILIAVIVLMLIAGSNTGNMKRKVQSVNSISNISNSTVAAGNHAPISIDGNGALATFISDEGLSGDGTFASPYIIENFIINDSTAHGIEIRSTNAYLLIQDCTIAGGNSNSIRLFKHGIFLNNTVNVKIINNTIHSFLFGILLRYSGSIIVSNNEIYNSNEGIRIQDSSSNNIVTRNKIYNNTNNGIMLYSNANSNIFLSNVISNNSGSGFEIESSFSNYFSCNNLSNNHANFVYYCDNNTIFANTILNHDVGWWLDDASDENKVRWNNFLNNSAINPSQVFDSGANNMIINNHWNEWTLPDIDEDGIVDDPYSMHDPNIDTFRNTDIAPLVNPYEIRGSRVIFPNGGEILTGETTVQWTPTTDSWGNNITYRIYYSINGGYTWTTLESGLTQTEYSFKSSLMNNGYTYLVKIRAIMFEGYWVEDTSDNMFTINNPVSTHTTAAPRITPGFTLITVLSMIAIILVIKRAWKSRKM